MSMSPVSSPTVVLCERVSNKVVVPAPATPINAVRVRDFTQPETWSSSLRGSPLIEISKVTFCHVKMAF
jgi:hypothetical protein